MYLRKIMRLKRQNEENENDSSSSSTKKHFFKICICGKGWYASSSFYNHKKSCSFASANEGEAGNYLCKEEDCTFKCKLSDDFVNHLRTSHKIEMIEDMKYFENYAEFKNWKEAFETEKKSSYVLCKSRKTARGKTEYFCCNRSGKYLSHSSGKRKLKSQGSSKIGYNCPARIIVQTSDSRVIAHIRHHHYGHDIQIAHLPLPNSVKQTLALQLLEGVEPSHILSNMFSSANSDLQRQHLCSKKDLFNISRCYGIKKIKKQICDAISLDAYLEELISDNTILLYKKQDDESQMVPKYDTCLLDKEDFALGIMTEFQKNMFIEFGNNVVCIDTTHRTNSSDFKLISILVLDEYSQAIPVAWLISNRATVLVLKMFFGQIKNIIGNMTPKVVMTDKSPQYFNSWNSTFDGNPKKMLCEWHVHYDWKQKLDKIWDKEAASTVYERLCLLMEEKSVDAFEDLLKKFHEQFFENKKTKVFGEYFSSEWVGIKEEWAKCFRVSAGIKTNIFFELFHETLNSVLNYLNGENEKQVDRCISVLLKFSKEHEIKRLLKKGNKYKMAQIHEIKKPVLEAPLTPIKKVSAEPCLEVSSLDSVESSGSQEIITPDEILEEDYSAASSSRSHYDDKFVLNPVIKEEVSVESIKQNVLQKYELLLEEIQNCNDTDTLLTVCELINNAHDTLKLSV